MSSHLEKCYAAHAKCILTGEHAVLRGHPAIVFPLQNLQIKLAYYESNTPLKADYTGAFGESMLLMFWGTLKKAFEIIERDIHTITGKLVLENNIPMCAGLGFSAAICIAIGRWFIDRNWLAENDLFSFARQLEDKFHQESSGVDIAGAISNEGVFYQRNSLPKKIEMNWQPKLYLSYSEQISVTAEAVKKVKQLFKMDYLSASRIDLDMAESVLIAKDALCLQEEEGMPLLIKAMTKARECFVRWDLISEKLEDHMQKLQKLGAVAVKPTGAGEGGHVLSLWLEQPKNISFELESVL